MRTMFHSTSRPRVFSKMESPEAFLMSADCSTTTIPLESRLMVSVSDAATMLSVTDKTIRLLIDRNELQARKVGRYLRVNTQSIRKYAAKT
jgi:excisionase family DNA binding protein